MKEKYTLTLDDNFVQFCQLNGKDVLKFANEIFQEGFMKHKYPSTPTTVKTNKIQDKTIKDNKENNNIYEE